MLYGYEKFVIAWFTLARHTKVPFCCVHVFGSANISLLLALSFVYDKSSTKTKPPWNEWNRAINSSFVLPFLSRLMLNTRVSSLKHAEVHICANMTFIPIHTRHGRKESGEQQKGAIHEKFTNIFPSQQTLDSSSMLLPFPFVHYDGIKKKKEKRKAKRKMWTQRRKWDNNRIKGGMLGRIKTKQVKKKNVGASSNDTSILQMMMKMMMTTVSDIQ